MRNNHHPDIDSDTIHVLPSHDIQLQDIEIEKGFILDIGAGGEGVIAHIKGIQVIGIDKRKDELMQTDDEALKIIMNATEMQFLDNTFPIVTLFFTLMYMPWDDIKKTFTEIKRVLQPGGQVLVWDVAVDPPDNPNLEYFMIPMNVFLPNGNTIETGYGASIRKQGMDDFIKIARDVGFEIVKKEKQGHFFFLELSG
jgi:ubiquinone/menaquinone biosynthesis C-methylase UbiE